MFRRAVIVSGLVLLLQANIVSAQERFVLSAPGTTTQSTADLTAGSLTITNQGKTTRYLREARYDAAGFTAFVSVATRQIIRWPTSGAGALQIASFAPLGAPVFRPSQMQITARMAPVGRPPVVGRPPIVGGGGGGGGIDVRQKYRLTNAFLGKTRSLAADARGTTTMDRSGDFANQSWQFELVGAKTYRLTNVALGATFSLAAPAVGDKPAMERTNPTKKSQLWRLVPDGGAIRISNEAFGPRVSLDTTNDAVNTPFLAASSNVTGQAWTFTLLAGGAGGAPGIVGGWQEYDVTTKRPAGHIDIRSDLSFVQTERGKPDLQGTVRLIGDRLTLVHSTGRQEPFRVTMTANRVDFRDVAGSPLGFYWQRTTPRAGALPPLMPRPIAPLPSVAPVPGAVPGAARMTSKNVVPNPPLPPVEYELKNSHKEELWVLLTDVRDLTQRRRLKIPAGQSVRVALERDAGSRIVEVWATTTVTGLVRQAERVKEVPPKQYYYLSVYELFVQSIDRTKGPMPIENRMPKSVGLIKIPPGSHFTGGSTDIYAEAKRRRNPGSVRRIEPEKWRDVAAPAAAPMAPRNPTAPTTIPSSPVPPAALPTAQAYIDRGDDSRETGQYAQAAADYERAVQMAPQDPLPWSRKAWLLATCSDAAQRNGAVAVEAAKKAVSLDANTAQWQHGLATALAATGDFVQAATTLERAIALLVPGRDDALGATIRRHLVLFRAKQAFIEHPRSAAVHVFLDATETRAFQAAFTKLDAGQVTLTKLDGTTVAVPLSRLAKSDQAWSREQVLIGIYATASAPKPDGVQIVRDAADNLMWANAAGATWSLVLKDSELWTGADCPLGEKKVEITWAKPGEVTSVQLGDRVYSRKP